MIHTNYLEKIKLLMCLTIKNFTLLFAYIKKLNQKHDLIILFSIRIVFIKQQTNSYYIKHKQ
jgi:hypothetical protein